MGYVGNHTTNSFTSMEKQDITGDGTPNYTLSHAVANANEIEVFVNNVRQEPSVAYNASGTTLTMTGNVASTDDFYVVYQGKAVGTIVPPDGSVTSAKLDTNIAISGNLDVGSIRATNGTAAMTIDSGGIVSSTAVLSVMYNSGSVTIPDNSETVIPLQTSAVDTHNLYDATNDRLLIPSAFNGSYFIISWSVMVTAANGDNMQCHLSKNGARLQSDRKFYNGGEGESISMHGVWMGQVSTNDYFGLIGFCDKDSGTSSSVVGLNNTFLYAAKLF